MAMPQHFCSMILYLAADLVWASKIKATADALSIACRPARTLEMLQARLADSDVKALVADLDKPEEALQMIAFLRRPEASPKERGVRVVAWGPHVAKDLLQAARDAGADSVMTRGSFDHDLEEILLRLQSAAPRLG
jgi:hypothetical protein